MEPLILVRWVNFAATLTAGGTIWFGLLMPQPLPPVLAAHLRGLVLAALAVTALSGAVWLALVAADVLGVSLRGLTATGAWSVVTDTRFGQVAAARLVLALLLAALTPWPRTRPAQGLLALGLVALPALTGHAGALPGPSGYGLIAVDMAHLLAAGAWLGGLPAFLLALQRTPDDWEAGDRLVRTTRRFSRLAFLAVATLLGTGLINSAFLLSGPADLLASDYGRRLGLKLVLFAAMLAFAAANRFRLTPALPGGGARRSLARNTLIETALGVGILAVVATLGTLPPPRHAHSASAAIPDDAAFVHIHTTEAMADVLIEPGNAGRSSVTARLWNEDMSELPARAVTIVLEPPKNSACPSSEQSATRQADGAWRINNIDCTQKGPWTVRLVITPRDGSKLLLVAPIVIAR